MEEKRSQKKTSHAGDIRRCVYCGSAAPLVWVHGHGQCSACGINVEECCRGEREKGESD